MSHVVALVSGGKDSTFGMIECIKRGYKIIALANLYPPNDQGEMDSFMYQSVGSEMIEAYAQCMELPLYRRPISGKPINIDYYYESSNANDEVEDLYELLKIVLEKHPSIMAVTSGAIMSSYQKNRVENVCSRMGLQSLAFLWQREQSILLREMIDNDINAILIKVAVIGIEWSILITTIIMI